MQLLADKIDADMRIMDDTARKPCD